MIWAYLQLGKPFSWWDKILILSRGLVACMSFMTGTRVRTTAFTNQESLTCSHSRITTSLVLYTFSGHHTQTIPRALSFLLKHRLKSTNSQRYLKSLWKKVSVPIENCGRAKRSLGPASDSRLRLRVIWLMFKIPRMLVFKSVSIVYVLYRYTTFNFIFEVFL